MDSLVENEEREKPRVILLTTSRSYRNEAFLSAAERLGIEIVLAVNMPQALSSSWSDGLLIDFNRLEESVAAIASYHKSRPVNAILPLDDSGTLLAAAAGTALGLPHNSASAAKATRDKLFFRRMLHGTTLNSPAYIEYMTGSEVETIADEVGFPCIVKPRSLNGSRGVIRADDIGQLSAAIKRTADLLRSLDGLAIDADVSLLIESYIPGKEYALEGVMDNGDLRVLALFDKPDPLEGPFFEETIYLTPSRLSAEVQAELVNCTAEAASAAGLYTGPLHAELRLNQDGPWIIEIAGRSIGGLCSQILQFGTAGSLEETILKQACGIPFQQDQDSYDPRGVMMIPIPGAGLLRQVRGLEEALEVPGIVSIEITVPTNNPVTPLPEGDGYLGFIFARDSSLDLVEVALRQAHDLLAFEIDPLLPVLQGRQLLANKT